ncbi:MAG: PEGA domain-containing protein [Myxococcota bacterium]
MPVVARLVVLALASLSLGVGCTHRVALLSDPVGAYVTMGETRVGVAPVEIVVPAFGGRVVSVQRTGYRTVELKLPLLPPREVEVRLVPEHGGAGSWDPEDID